MHILFDVCIEKKGFTFISSFSNVEPVLFNLGTLPGSQVPMVIAVQIVREFPELQRNL